MSKKIFLKLASTSGSYVDQRNTISISGKQVIEVPEDLLIKSTSIARALDSGHIKKATEEEYEAWLELSGRESDEPIKASGAPEKTEKNNNEDDDDEDDDDDDDDFNTMSKSELLDVLKNYTLSEEDLKDLNKKNKDTLIALCEKYTQ